MWLGIDTSGDVCAVALFEHDRLVRRLDALIGRGHAERLMPMIRDLAPGDAVRSIVVTVGPGSFTGIRVGVAAARALGLAWGAPVHGVSTMSLAAAGAFARETSADLIQVALAGQRGTVYLQDFARLGGGFAERTDVRVIDAALGEGAPALADPEEDGAPSLRARACGPPRIEHLPAVPVALRRLPPTPLYVRSAYAQAPAC